MSGLFSTPSSPELTADAADSLCLILRRNGSGVQRGRRQVAAEDHRRRTLIEVLMALVAHVTTFWRLVVHPETQGLRW